MVVSLYIGGKSNPCFKWWQNGDLLRSPGQYTAHSPSGSLSNAMAKTICPDLEISISNGRASGPARRHPTRKTEKSKHGEPWKDSGREQTRHNSNHLGVSLFGALESWSGRTRKRNREGEKAWNMYKGV